MKPVTRRSVMASSAAVVGAAVPVFAATVEGGDELARLIRLYFQQVDAFNTWCRETHPDDDEFDAVAESTFQKTLDQMVGVPVRTREDALAALDFMVREGVDLEGDFHWPGSFGQVTRSLISGSAAIWKEGWHKGD